MTARQKFKREKQEVIDLIASLEVGEGAYIKEKEWGSKTSPNVAYFSQWIFEDTGDMRLFGTRRIDEGWVVYRKKDSDIKTNQRKHE